MSASSGDHSRWNGLKAPKKAAERLALSQPRHRRSAPPKLKRLTDRLLMRQANFPTAIHHPSHHLTIFTSLSPLLLDTPFQHCDHERPYRRDQAFPGPEAGNVSPVPNTDPPIHFKRRKWRHGSMGACNKSGTAWHGIDTTLGGATTMLPSYHHGNHTPIQLQTLANMPSLTAPVFARRSRSSSSPTTPRTSLPPS